MSSDSERGHLQMWSKQLFFKKGLAFVLRNLEILVHRHFPQLTRVPKDTAPDRQRQADRSRGWRRSVRASADTGTATVNVRSAMSSSTFP